MRNFPLWSQEKFLKAYHFAARVHHGQKYSGTELPYIMHVTFVCMEIIASLEVEQVNKPDLAVQAAILHDVIEDTKVGSKKLEEEFGAAIAEGVLLLTKNTEITDKDKRFEEYMARLADASKEIKMVKLADRISNLQTPPFHWNKEKITDYTEKSRIILEKLGDASPYLSKRLKQKINNYPG